MAYALKILCRFNPVQREALAVMREYEVKLFLNNLTDDRL